MRLISVFVLLCVSCVLNSCSVTLGYTDPKSGAQIGLTVAIPEKLPDPKSLKK